MSTENEKASEVFIGARNLEDQIGMILPTFDLLMDQIEQIRATAKLENVKANDNSKYTQYKKDINNTIGIFGARGTGKTSVLYTTINKLMGENNNSQAVFPKPENIILPIIEPDQFGDNTKIIGSIVGLLKNVVEEQLLEIESSHNKDDEDYFNKCVYKLNNPLKKSLNELIEYHMYTATEYRSLLINNYDDMATHIKKSANLLIPDIEFKQKLHKLISLLIEKKRDSLKKSKNSADRASEPLIFLFIDDIDLKTNKVRELVEALLQYTNHPNIVTVLSGDYDVLQEALMLALLQDEKLQEGGLEDTSIINTKFNIIERKQNLSSEYLKKIIPPVRRHQLVQWNNSTIPKFAFGEETLSMQLQKLLLEDDIFNYQSKENGKKIPLNESYKIFDLTPRGIVNVYYHIYEINKRKAKLQNTNNYQKEDLFYPLKSLIDTIIISSGKLTSKQSWIFENYIQWGNNFNSTVINYRNLKKEINKEIDESSINIRNITLELLIIGEIIEIIIPKICKNNDKYIKKEVFNYSLDLKPYNEMGKFYLYSFYEIILVVFKNTNLKYSLLFKKIISENLVLEDMMEVKTSHFSYEQNKEILIAIDKITANQNDPDLFNKIYYKSYIDSKNTDEYNFLKFIQDNNIQTSEFEYYKFVYDSFINLKDNYLEPEEKELFINSFIRINSLNTENLKNEIVNKNIVTENSQLYRVLKKVVDNKIELNIIQFNKIDKSIKKFYLYILKVSKEKKYEISFKNHPQVKDEINNFLKKRPFTKTRYEDTLNYIEKDLKKFRESSRNHTISEYHNVIVHLYTLSINFRVLYGQQEAHQLISVLKQNAYINTDFLENEEILIIKYLLEYYKIKNPNIIEDMKYNNVKQSLRIKLERAMSQAKITIKNELKEIDFDFLSEEDDDVE